MLPMDGDGKPVPFLISEFDQRQARFSPDGHWVAYSSDESGVREVYVRSFSMNSAGTAVEVGGKWPISVGGGHTPRWRGDGRELYYLTSALQLMAVEIATTPTFRVGPSHPLGYLTSVAFWAAADGRRFLSLGKAGGQEPYTVVLNWQSGLKK